MRAEVFWVEGIPHRLAVMPRPRGGDWLSDEARSLREQGVDVLVSLLTEDEATALELEDERLHCESNGIVFVSFPIEDRSVPADLPAALQLVATILDYLRGGKGVAVHCRGGIGRSAMLAACVLKKLGLGTTESFELIGVARGWPVPDTDEQRRWVDEHFGVRSDR